MRMLYRFYFIERYERNEMDIMFQELNTPFSVESILKAIGQLNTNKIARPDMFLNEFFMHGKLITVQIFTCLI